jgi:hypothetical protein
MTKLWHRAVLVLALLTAAPAWAEDLYWRNFDYLNQADRAQAEETLTEMFGGTVELWPDWIEPSAIQIPAGPGKTLMIVRYPLRLPCGENAFFIFGPATPEGRPRLGDRFCAGALTGVFAQPKLPWLDLQFAGYGEQGADGQWHDRTIRLRWTDKGWMIYPPV